MSIEQWNAKMIAETRPAHTPGPWKLETVVTSVGLCHKIGDFPKSCGHDPSYACVYEDGMSRRAIFPRVEETELLANARLIAAAPELLAACRKLLAAYNDARAQGHGTILMEEARAAIAKAEGRE